ncbi:ribonuclease H-like domain-containing protein [Tanacetum coccineum]
MTAVCQVLMNLTQIPQVMMNLRQLRQIFQLHQVYVEEIVSSKGLSNKFLKWYEDDTDEEEEEFWFKKPKDKGNGSKSTTSECLSTPKARGLLISKLLSLIKENSLGDKGKRVQANMPGIKVSHPNGIEALITKVGNLNLTKFLTLHDVLVVPTYFVTFVSVRKVARDSKFIVGFDESKCFLISHDLMDVKIMEIGRQVNGLYFFDNMEVVHEGPDTSYDDNGSNASDHYDGSNGSVSESERAATSNNNTSLSEDDVAVNDTTDHVHVLNNQPLRRSERTSVFPNKYNEYVVDSKEACKDQHWIEAMNKEMDALYKNDNWEFCDLPKDRKSIDLDETVYMDLPEGFYSSDDKRVCKLKKSLYGLKQAPRQWNAKLTQTLVECGFKQSKSDYSLFTKSEKGNFLALLVYVDDIIVTGNNVDEIEKFKEFLRTKFQIKDLGKLKYFLGIEVLETDFGICLSQRKYCLDLLSEYGLLACKLSATPLEQNLAISNEPTKIDKFMHNPLRSHIKIALKVLRYLKSNTGKGVHIVKQPKTSLEAFVDADWAYKKQHTLAKSSAEAEYIAMASVTSEVTWILKILRDLE